MASNLRAMASNLVAMASSLRANGLQPSSDGLQPNSDGFQPSSDGLQPSSASLFMYCSYCCVLLKNVSLKITKPGVVVTRSAYLSGPSFFQDQLLQASEATKLFLQCLGRSGEGVGLTKEGSGRKPQSLSRAVARRWRPSLVGWRPVLLA